MKKLMMISLVTLLSACAPMAMDCCKNMKDGQMCPTDGSPCPMECCKKMQGDHKGMKH